VLTKDFEGTHSFAKWRLGLIPFLSKDKVALCLIKHHIMKADGEWRYSFAILNLCTSCRWVVSFMPQQLHLWGNNPQYLLGRRLGGPQSQFGHCGEGGNILHLLGIEPCISVIHSIARLVYWLSCYTKTSTLRAILIDKNWKSDLKYSHHFLVNVWRTATRTEAKMWFSLIWFKRYVKRQ
jgi:hypothetical protein